MTEQTRRGGLAVLGPEGVADIVEIELPASAAYLAVLRTLTASLAARLDFTLDEIEDLRIAVDEACALLLAGVTSSNARLECVFRHGDGALTVTICAPSQRTVQRDSFAWTVLSALAGEIETKQADDGRQMITLTKRRSTGAGE